MIRRKYFDDDEEYRDLLRLPNVIPQDSSYENISLSPKAQELYDWLKKTNRPGYIDQNNPSYNLQVSKKITDVPVAPSSYMDEPGSSIVKKDGYSMLCLPAGTKFYKGLTWFYEDLPAHPKQIWVGSRHTATQYVINYSSGMVVYRSTRDVHLFIFSPDNMDLMYKGADGHVKKALENVFGLGLTVRDKLVGKNQDPTRPIVLYNEIENCTKASEKFLYGQFVSGINWRDDQHTIIDYALSLGCDGTVLPSVLSPTLPTCFTEEVTIDVGAIVMDKDDPLYWKNWGLDESKLTAGFSPPAMSEKFNFNYKVTDYYFDFDDSCKKINDTFGILSYNVHGLRSYNGEVDVDMAYKKLVAFVNKTSPDVLVVQEMVHPYITRLKDDCGFRKMRYVSNGSRNNSLFVVAYTRKPSEMETIFHSSKNNFRNAVLVTCAIGGNKVRIVGCHLDIGRRYLIKHRLAYIEKFQDIYDYNVRLRKGALDKILSYSPDIIVGDMNFMPDSEECGYLVDKGFTFDPTPPTTVHRNKVDFLFYRFGAFRSDSQVIKYNESDHRPLLTQLSSVVSGGSASHGWLAIVILLIVILAVFIFGTAVDLCFKWLRMFYNS